MKIVVFAVLSLFVLPTIFYSLMETGAQVLSGNIESIQYFSTCDQSPLGDTTSPKTWIQPNSLNKLKTTQSFCEIAGAKTNITAVRMLIQADRVAGSEILTFRIPSLPSSGIISKLPSNVNNEFPCAESQKQGYQCKVLDKVLALSISSSDIAAMYQLAKRYNLVLPYGMLWFQCDNITNSLSNQPPPSGSYSYTQQAPDNICSNFKSQDYTKNLNNPDCTTSYRSSLGTILNLQNGDVCPTTNDPELLQYYSNPDQTPLTKNCAAIMCPNKAGTYNYGVARSIGPVCEAFEINPSPQAVANILITVSLISKISNQDPVTGLVTEQEVVTPVTNLTLGTLQKGKLEMDPLGIISGAVLNFVEAFNGIAQPLKGTIIACNNCEQDINGEGCTMKPVSDIPASSELPSHLNSNGFLAATTNPYTFYADRLGKCVLPIPKCRQLLLNDPNEMGRWSYRNEEQSFSIGTGCNAYGMRDDAYFKDPTIAELICQGGMQGACITGYQQVYSGAVTPGITTQCELEYAWANGLTKNPLTNFPQGNGMPDNYNVFAPPYWLDGNRLYSTPEFGQTNSLYSLDIILYMTGNYTGTFYPVAKANFVDFGMICTLTEGSSTSEIAYTVVNNDTIPGDFYVTVNFTIPKGAPQGEDFSITKLTAETFSLKPGQQINGLFTGIRYDGPYPEQLIANGYVFSQVQTAYSPAGQLLSYANQSCSVQGVETFVSIFGEQTFGIYQADNGLPPGGRNNTGCSAIDLGCWHGGIWFWIKRCIVLVICLIIVLLFIGAVIGLGYVAFYSNRRRRDNREADKYMKQRQEDLQAIQQLKDQVAEQKEQSKNEPAVVVQTGTRRKGKGRGKIPMGYTISIFLSLIALASANVLVLKITPDRTCLNTVQSSSGLNCSQSGFSTKMDLRVQANTIDLGGSSGLIENPQVFKVRLTVIPHLKNETQFGNGTHCQTQPCRLTIPAEMTIEMMKPKERWNLQPLFTASGNNALAPYVFYFNSVSSVNLTENNRLCRCTYKTTVSDRSSIPMKTIDPDHSEFNDPILNQAHFQCPVVDATNPTRPKSSYYNTKRSKLEYGWSCSCPDGKSFSTVISNEFYSLEKGCGLYRITNPAELVTGIRINITLDSLSQTGADYNTVLKRLGNPAISEAVKNLLIFGHNETLEIQSIQQGFNGASNVSEPYHLVSAQIVSAMSPSDIHGTFLDGVILSCRDDPADPAQTLLNMKIKSGDRDGFFDSFRNPWTSINGQKGALLTPIPENINQMIDNNGVYDAFAQFAYLNESQLPWISQGCDGIMVNPDTMYDGSSNVLDLSFLRGENVEPVYFEDLVPVNQMGTGWFQTLLTCVPGFNKISPLNRQTVTPCGMQSVMKTFQNSLQSIGLGDIMGLIRQMPAPFLPWIWNIFSPNVWISEGYLWHEPAKGTALAETAWEIITELSGDYVASLTNQPKGEISHSISNTNCKVTVRTDQNTQQTFNGDVFYRVCNQNEELAGSYSVNVECGFLTQYNEEFDFFNTSAPLLTSSKATVSTHPSILNIPVLAPATCASLDEGPPVSINGALYDVPDGDNNNVVNEVLVDSAGNSQLICRVRVYTGGSVYARDTLNSDITLTCDVETSDGQRVLNPAGDLGPQPSPFPSGTVAFVGPSFSPIPDRRTSPKPSPEDQRTTDTLWFGGMGIIVLLVAAMVITLIAVCIDVRRRT